MVNENTNILYLFVYLIIEKHYIEWLIDFYIKKYHKKYNYEVLRKICVLFQNPKRYLKTLFLLWNT